MIKINENRDLKGVWIPKEIYLADYLSWTEKMLLIEIDSLDKEDTHCFASNEHFCNFLGIKDRQLRDCLNTLRIGLLIENVSFDGRTRIMKSNIKYMNEEEWRKTAGLIGKHKNMQKTTSETGVKLPCQTL